MNTIYCTNCGSKNIASSKFCSKCGCSLINPSNTYQKRATSSSILWVLGIVAIVICCIVISYSNKSNKSSLSCNILSKEKTQHSIQSIKNINEMSKAIDNTIWTHTEVGDLIWTKLEFKGNKVRIYTAMPSDGKWTFDEECSYTLEEGRFIDDGRRYVAAVIKSKDMEISPKFVITNGHLSWLGIIDAGGFILGDYEWD